MRYVIGVLVLFTLLACSANAELRHRYSFNDGDASDSVGEADGTLVNDPRIQEGQLVFDPRINDGESADLQKGQYVVLPGGIMNHRSWTVEVWATYRGGQPWQRIVDFGNCVKATEAEKAKHDLTEKKAMRGRGFLAIMHNRAGNILGQCSVASWGSNTDTDLCIAHQGLTLHREHHIVYTHDPDLREQKLYVDGELAGVGLARVDARDTSWDKCYIGRSQFTWDPLYNGRVNELRIYDHALSREEVQAHAEAGPDAKVGQRVSRAK